MDHSSFWDSCINFQITLTLYYVARSASAVERSSLVMPCLYDKEWKVIFLLGWYLPRPLKEWYIQKLLFSYSKDYVQRLPNANGTNTNSSRHSAGDTTTTNPKSQASEKRTLRQVETYEHGILERDGTKGSFGSRTSYSQWWGWCYRSTR